MGRKVMIRFWWESGLSSAFRNHLTTFCRHFVHYTCFKTVFRDSLLYPKQLSLFCLLWLISACADRIGYITNFCSMIELLHQLKTAVVDIEAFRHLIMLQQGKRTTKNLLDLCITKNRKFSCVLYRRSQFVCSLARFDLANRGVRQTVQSHTFCAPLLSMLHCTYSTRH